MNPLFFSEVEKALAAERLDVYRQDGVTPAVALARYLWNMALCEAFYSPLQIVEIALRNAIHSTLTTREGNAAWYNTISGLPHWQQDQVHAVRAKLLAERKPETPGRVVAELHFGFWTGFFNGVHARTGIGYALSHKVFAKAPRREQNMKQLDTRLSSIRELRNRVFHHERIIHWTDLDAQHAGILELVGWISPELRELARALDRYTPVRKAGTDPWIDRLRRHWPDPSIVPVVTPTSPGIARVPDVCDASNGTETPFGHRWGGDTFALRDEHMDALIDGHTLALDVQSEYVAFLKHATQPPTSPTPAPAPTHANTQPHTPPDAKIGASGHGG